MSRFICIHGHFYQPPRENPWLDEVEIQDSAYPYHDWNERVNAECYDRNTAARILDDNRKIVDIVNNYSRISFNFGPTLLSWMEQKAPDTYAAILEADRLSQTFYSGHGSALAQVYNHMIMPLANEQDKRTQIIWGLKDFEYRFKRKAEGMWLAETAVDTRTLDLLVEYGIKFTVLAPNQALRVREIGQDMLWRDTHIHKVDPRVPYLCHLPSGKTIVIFFYDGPTSQGVAFEGLLNNGEHFARRLIRDFNINASGPQLVHIATDGETYGHHHKFGDMALAYCLHHIQHHDLAKLTIYGEFLEKFPVRHEVQIVENSSWSCAHGVERWRSDCGCSTGGGSGWNQAWRTPLREALDWLRDQMIPLYEQEMRFFDIDPWVLRNEYIDVILNRQSDVRDAFLKRFIKSDLPDEARIKLLKLLEMQLNAMLMYTSCGWFFNDISGLETVQVLKYAACAIQLAKETSNKDLEEEFIARLEKAVSNIPEMKNGAFIYRTMVMPSVVDLLRVGAHYAMTSLFEHYPAKAKMYSYTVKTEQYILKEAGRLRLAVGHAVVSSGITTEKANIQFAVLHLGDHNFVGGVDYFKADDFLLMQRQIIAAFLESNIPEVIGLINKYFTSHNYSLWHLFKQEQQNILNQVLRSTMEDIDSSFRQIYEHHYPLMQIKNEIRLPLPRMLMTVVEFILNRDLCAVLEAEQLDVDRLRSLVDEMKRWSFKRDQHNFTFIASNRISQLMKELSVHPDNIELMERITTALEIIKSIGLELELWQAQNMYFAMGRSVYPEIALHAPTDILARRWVMHFERLGEILDINVQAAQKFSAINR